MNTTATVTTQGPTYDALCEANATMRRLQARGPADWAHDGYSIQGAQAAVEAARADYWTAWDAYRATFDAVSA